MLVHALLPHAYISCESESCDEDLIGISLPVNVFLDDDKSLIRMQLPMQREIHTVSDRQNSHNVTSDTKKQTQIDAGYTQQCNIW